MCVVSLTLESDSFENNDVNLGTYTSYLSKKVLQPAKMSSKMFKSDWYKYLQRDW